MVTRLRVPGSSKETLEVDPEGSEIGFLVRAICLNSQAAQPPASAKNLSLG